MSVEIKENTENQNGLSRIIEQLKEQLKNLEAVRKNDKLWKKIDHINLQVEQTKEINTKYNQLLTKNPNSFETVYHAIAILSKNTDIFNDKVEIMETFIDEMDKKTIILRDIMLKMLAIIEKMPLYINSIKQNKGIVRQEPVQ
ncbi:MAG: hypothetical protein LBL50_04195 [Candidatus Margulisbacteria bacterium]|jgi:hypothetical protein|nr:hypothetical protein [Candidatus Margulisiibacteriota bacterium]